MLIKGEQAKHANKMARQAGNVQAHAIDMSFLPDYSSSSQGVRKRKHSDDPDTAVASGASTPGYRASPPSHSASASSTPPSSIQSISSSPFNAKQLDGDDPEQPFSDERATEQTQSQDDGQLNGSKRRRVFNVEDNDQGQSSAPEYRNVYPIVIADDEDNEDDQDGGSNSNDSQDLSGNRSHQDNNVLSDQADDECSVVEVYGGSPGPSNDSASLNEVSRRREQSTTPTQLSDDSNATITPATANHTQRRSGSVERRAPTSRAAAEIVSSHVDDPEVEEVLEVIDLTRPERRTNYPRGDSLPRVPGLTPQHSFHLPTLQRLVSRSSESMERSQSRRANNSGSSIDVHEILDDDEDEEGDDQEDRFGNNTVRIDSEVREVQLDPRHPWAQGPIQLILSPDRRGDDDQYLEGQRRRRLEDAVIVDDHLAQIDYDYVESESDADGTTDQPEHVEIEDDGVSDEQIQADTNWILNLRRNEMRTSPASSRSQEAPSFQARSPPFQMRSPPPFQARSPPFQARSPPFEAPSFSFEARPSSFPTSSRRSATPQTNHRPVARRPSPVPLILPITTQRATSPPSASTTVPTSGGVISAQAGSKMLIKGLLKDSDATPATESWANQNLKCSICMDVMNIPTMVRCGHAFCRECIHRAMETSKICPMCRCPANKSKLQELEFYVGSVRSTDAVEGGVGASRGSMKSTGNNSASKGNGISV
ncbi:hypothetical protein BGX21_006179 [Mortierella sp. AD011]|nr:hypothetical protein BGX20_004569 [Mortierella sp. AD010]KAF9399470.1 hypothetical protein BGX21_006179 [Mortierella sp. AD011]